MMELKDAKTLGDIIFAKIANNKYLLSLYDDLLFNYSIKKLGVREQEPREINTNALLRFADLLSKSTSPDKEMHKIWAQEIVSLLLYLTPDDPSVNVYANSVFHSTSNLQATKLIKNKIDIMPLHDKIFNSIKEQYLKVPAAPESAFCQAQKSIYDKLSSPMFSYSGPTSMGKSFIMRMFIKEKIMQGIQNNYALIVPTKALINELSSQLISDLNNTLKEKNYKIVTAAGDNALKGKHNFIFVLTPERLLYLLISSPDTKLDYLFIDEAQKLSKKDSRSPFYYKVVDILLNRANKPHFIFASPNIPNPEIYLKLLSSDTEEIKIKSLHTNFSPVSQIKYIIDIQNNTLSYYNTHSEKAVFLSRLIRNRSLPNTISRFIRDSSSQSQNQTLVYVNSKEKAVTYALDFAKELPYKSDLSLSILSKEISQQVHKDYYLSDLIKKGVAYHIGYLPTSIRQQIEALFKEGKLSIIFCTSTLLEGINLPADNLFVCDCKISKRKMDAIDFRNLIGRVGRIRYNLYGNVFFVAHDKIIVDDYTTLLSETVCKQTLSIETDMNKLTKDVKENIVTELSNGSVEFKPIPKQPKADYDMIRKFALILLKDIIHNNNSLVRREFAPYLSPEKELCIKNKFGTSKIQQDDDINASVDQICNLHDEMSKGLEFPSRKNGGFDYSLVLHFLSTLSKIFKWEKYEPNTLGQASKRKWYAVILIQWMQGNGLNYIMTRAIDYHKKHPDSFYMGHTRVHYSDTKEQRNKIFNDTLAVLEDTILFRLSNYFLRFANEYKKIHEVNSFQNNWYEYVEYGTTDALSIFLQKSGFSREVSTYIKKHEEAYVIHDNGNYLISTKLLRSPSPATRLEAVRVKYNMPELFVEQ